MDQISDLLTKALVGWLWLSFVPAAVAAVFTQTWTIVVIAVAPPTLATIGVFLLVYRRRPTPRRSSANSSFSLYRG